MLVSSTFTQLLPEVSAGPFEPKQTDIKLLWNNILIDLILSRKQSVGGIIILSKLNTKSISGLVCFSSILVREIQCFCKCILFVLNRLIF